MSKDVVAAGNFGAGVFVDGRVGTCTRTRTCSSSQVVKDTEGLSNLPIHVLCVACCTIATSSSPEETRYGTVSTDDLRLIILARGCSRRKENYGYHDE